MYRFDDALVTSFGQAMPELEQLKWQRNGYIAVYAHRSSFASS
jgi:hypothetical protein